jgi:hypothetical protein
MRCQLNSPHHNGRCAEAVMSHRTRLITGQLSSCPIGGIPAGSLPPDEIVSDPNGSVFAVDPSITGTFTGSITLNLQTGEFSATWAVQQATSTITGFVRCVEDTGPPPSDRFMFVVPQDHAGFYVLTTTNI